MTVHNDALDSIDVPLGLGHPSLQLQVWATVEERAGNPGISLVFVDSVPDVLSYFYRKRIIDSSSTTRTVANQVGHM
jgi:hypothetical protein